MMIRKMRKEDVEETAKVLSQCFPDPWSEKSLLDMFRIGGYLCYVAAERDICGCVCMKTVLDEGDITTVAVLPGYRRAGTGRKLVAAVLKEAAGRGIRTVFLEVRASNDPARRLYEEQGFETAGIRKQYYEKPPEDAVIMRCHLPG